MIMGMMLSPMKDESHGTKKHPIVLEAKCSWWRASRYEIRDGRIAPRPGAKTELIDLWTDADPRQSKTTPYEELISLAHRLSPDPISAEPDEEQSILAFCGKWGLFGLLPQMTMQAELATVRQDDDTEAQTVYTRIPGGWNELTRPAHQAIGSGQVVGCFKLASPIVETRPIAAVWPAFFDGIGGDSAGQHQYPSPESPEFRHRYGEPLHAWKQAAQAFAMAARRTRLRTKARLKPHEKSMLSDALRQLEQLAAPISPFAIVGKKQSIEPVLAVSAQLSALAAMFLQQLRTGAELRPCKAEDCQGYFLATNPRRMFCTTQCEDRSKKQKKRAVTPKRRPHKT